MQRETRLTTPDGRLTFVLCASRGGVHVARLFQSGLQQVEQVTVFPDAKQFQAYLDHDDLRFEYVSFYVVIRKVFDELL